MKKQEHDSADVYLGDGVYASFDGYYVWLAVNDHMNVQVALEKNVILHLIEYAKTQGMIP